MDHRTFTLLRDLARTAPVAVRVKGDCMVPSLPEEATATVRARTIYLPGDVIVFRRPSGDLAAHRLLGYRWSGGRAALVAKGDHAAVHDAPVFADALIGAIADIRVTFAERCRALLDFGRIVARRALA